MPNATMPANSGSNVMKSGSALRFLLIAPLLVPGVHSASSQPSLGIAPAGNQSVLYWSASPTNYLLQSATNLASPNWVIAIDAMPMTAATVSNTLPARFFRLIYPDPPAGMVLIPGGTFIMGNSVGDSLIKDADPTNVYVSAFYMDTNLVTYQLWQTVYNAAITFYGYSFVNAGAGKAANHPVQAVDWYDCAKWCNARSQLAGLTPAYYKDIGFTQVYKTAETNAVYVNWGANGFRLPTEAEWEKAARGGLNGRRFPWGNLISESQANYYGEMNVGYDLGPNGYNPIGSVGGTSPATSPVGSFDVNGYGLYDMAGNVMQWCWDWYGTPYGQPTLSNPVGPATGNVRVLRGGCGGCPPGIEPCAHRDASIPNNSYYYYGLRCVRGL
jgi:formylglycine-generating enzyme required for sulfatase activity